MTRERWRQVTEMFHAALARDVSARDGWVVAQCGDDEALRREVEALLAAHGEAGPFDAALGPATQDGPPAAAAAASAVALPLAPGCRLGPYEIGSLLGTGGMGAVYRAHDGRLQRDVALKVLLPTVADDPDRLARFAREARLLAALNHPHIAQVYGLEEAGRARAIVMELVEGPTLADRIARGPLPLDDALGIARQIAQALEAAHEHGIVHRDLKPANIAMRPDGAVKVLDFGLAKAPDEGPVAAASTNTPAGVTKPGLILGTAAYMAPEQARGQPVDRRADIWAFGCVLFEMLTGRAAFAGETLSDIIARILERDPEWQALPVTTPDSIRTLLHRCLAKNPRQRLDSAAAVRLEVDAARTTPAGDTREAASSHVDARRSRARKRRLVGATLMLVGGFLVTATGVWLFGDGEAPGAVQREQKNGQPGGDPISFVVNAPRGTAFQGLTMGPFPTLSPDGRMLTFVAEKGTERALWIQRIGDLEATALAGTEGAEAPFWSPDGSYIGFVSGGQLKKVAVAGDRPVQIVFANARQAAGGAWTAAGAIIFVGVDGLLYRVGADGGDAVPVTRRDSSRGEGAHRWPVMLPGSASLFVYVISSTRDETRGLYLGSLDDAGVKRRLTPDESNGAFGLGPDGILHLLFVRDSTLLAQKFDEVNQRLTGEPLVVARPVRPGENGRWAPFTVAGRTLVYRPATPADSRLVWMDRQGERQGVIGAAGVEYRYPSLSPDGDRLAVAQYGPGPSDIWVFDLRQGTSERLSRDPVGAAFPVWMPDSRRVVFASAREGPWNVYRQATTGHEGDELLGSLAPAAASRYPTSVTHDGRSVLLQNNGVWRLTLTDPPQWNHVVRSAIQGRVSPNGRWLAYTSTEGPERQVYVTTFPVPGDRWRVSTVRGEDPQWRRDGRELYYIENADTLKAMAIDDAISYTAGMPRTLFRASFASRSMNFGPAYAPAADGQRFLVVEGVQSSEILLRATINWVPGR